MPGLLVKNGRVVVANGRGQIQPDGGGCSCCGGLRLWVGGQVDAGQGVFGTKPLKRYNNGLWDEPGGPYPITNATPPRDCLGSFAGDLYASSFWATPSGINGINTAAAGGMWRWDGSVWSGAGPPVGSPVNGIPSYQTTQHVQIGRDMATGMVCGWALPGSSVTTVALFNGGAFNRFGGASSPSDPYPQTSMDTKPYVRAAYISAPGLGYNSVHPRATSTPFLGGTPSIGLVEWTGTARDWTLVQTGEINTSSYAWGSDGALYVLAAARAASPPVPPHRTSAILLLGGGGLTQYGSTAITQLANASGASIEACTVWNGLVVVGGERLWPNGNVAFERIFFFDGSNVTIPPQPNGKVLALAVYGSDLIVGGQFTAVGSVTARGLARWDGSAWHAMGTRSGTIVHSLLVEGAGCPDCFGRTGQPFA